MTRKKGERDQAILRALSGCDDLKHSHMQIVDDYLIREVMENRREQGFWVSRKWLPEPRTDVEKSFFIADKAMEELEANRVNRPMDEYPGQEEDTMEKKESNLKLFDLKNDNKVVIRIGEHTLTLEKKVRWLQGKKGERTGQIEKSYITGLIQTAEGKELKLIFGASGNIWAGHAVEEVKEEQVITL